MSNCECFTKTLKRVNEKLKAQLFEKEAATLNAEWQNAAIIFEENTVVMNVSVPVSYNYQKFKKSGEPHKNVTKDTINILMSYCPFCGGNLSTQGQS